MGQSPVSTCARRMHPCAKYFANPSKESKRERGWRGFLPSGGEGEGEV